MSLSVVILAAGKGTRMFSEQPKVLHKLADQPMLQYVIDIANELNPKNTNVIVGHKAKEVMHTLSHEKVNWILQEKQLGTGDAVKYAIPNLTGEQTLILYGDVPLVKINELKKLMELRNEIMLCGEIYNDCNWENYDLYNELVKKYNSER